MNLFQLVLKQMRQRALSTWLTLLSVLLGSALAVGVLILQRESENLFVQKDFGYDLIVGTRGGEMNLVLNTVYHVGKSQGNIPYVVYETLRNDRKQVKHAVPFLVGDTYKGYRVVGTLPSMFGFDDSSGKPMNGYDEAGRRRADFEPPTTDDRQRQPGKQYAASTFEYKVGRKFTLAAGRMFHPRKFEAVLGSEAAERSGTKIGDKIKVAHDAPAGRATEIDEHHEQWEVVGVLDKTYTAEDRVVFVPLISSYAIPEHEKVLDALGKAREDAGLTAPAKHDDHDDDDHDKHKGHDDDDHGHAKAAASKPASKPAAATAAATASTRAVGPSTRPAAATTTAAAHGHGDHDDDDDDDHHHHAPAGAGTRPATKEAHHHEGHHHEDAYEMNADGTIALKLSRDRWMLSGVLVKSVSNPLGLVNTLMHGDSAMGVMPALEMQKFFLEFLSPINLVLLVLALMVLVTAAVSILVSIYNAVSARSREIAIMRALGATRGKVLSLICVEAGLIGLAGGVIGMLLGHGLAAVGSTVFAKRMGTGINWTSTSWHEWVYLGGVVLVAVLAGLVPGLKAYRTPVATNLVAA